MRLTLNHSAEYLLFPVNDTKSQNNIYGNKNSPELTSSAILPTTPHEIIDMANLAKYSPSDGIDPLIARKTIEPVVIVVSDMINSSFITGIIHVHVGLTHV